MLLFFLVAIVVGILAYFFFRSEESPEPQGTRTPVDRGQDTRRKRKKSSNQEIKIHEKKVVNKTRNELKSAKERAQNLKEKVGLKEIARESYALSASLRKMFSSDQFFDKKRRFESFQAAIEVAENARDKLIDRQKKDVHPTDIPDGSASDYVTDKYVKNFTESTLMVMWCAGGLIGKSRYEAAQEVFQVPVSMEDVQSWEQFGQVLQKESRHYMGNPPDPTSPM